MLMLQSRVLMKPVASVQAGHRIGKVIGFVIQPKGLKIAALLVESVTSSQPLYLHTEDILETRNRGILIDHNEQLMDGEGLIRLADLLEINFEILQKPVIDEGDHKLGTASDFIINSSGWLVQKVHVQPPMIKMLGKSDKIIDRTQIVRVTDNQIIVRDTSTKQEGFSKSVSRQIGLAGLRASPAKRD